LPDGNYTARLLGTGIRDSAGNPLDGDGDLLAGGNFDDAFYVLAADANRDGVVDVGDLGILAANWQQSPRTFADGDFDYSGTVEVSDLGILAGQWQGVLPALPARFAPFDPTSGFPRSTARITRLADLLALV
jgi:hypothetical protein